MVKINSLQYCRAFAACSVVLFHTFGRFGGAFKIGEAGVDLFFLLSGFLMIMVTGDDAAALSFLRGRVRRIVPAYWIATTVLLTGAVAGLFPNLVLQPWHILASYLFIPARTSADSPIWPLLVPGWTLNYEMMFYLLFALTMPMRSQLRQMAFLTGLFAFTALIGGIVQPRSAIGAFYCDPIMLEFAAGGWIGLAWKHVDRWPAWIGWPTGVAAIMLGLAVAMMHTDRNRVILFGIPALLLLVSVLGAERRRPIGHYALPMLVGDASYSIYLWHPLAISLGVAVTTKLHLPTAMAITISALGGVVAGIVAFRLVERPLLKRRRGSSPAPASIPS